VADFKIEKSFLNRGHRYIAGVDEVGRGALCGPVVAAAVVFPSYLIMRRPPAWVRETRDSKLLSGKKRRELAEAILFSAEAVGIGLCTNLEIDRWNIFRASHEAMRRAIGRMEIRPDIVLVDGLAIPGFPGFQEAIPKGDKKSRTIAAASIIAKVLRDRIMMACDRIYPGYGLAKNAGYGTEEHYRALDRLGPSPFHRRSFKLQWDKRLF
jgi:ribonuclease HII